MTSPRSPSTTTLPPDAPSGAPGGVRRWHLAVATALLALGAYASLSVGVVRLPWSALVAPTAEEWDLLLLSRIPRVLAILLAGAAMAVAGLVMQRITQNNFVSPSTSGTVEAAVLGLLLATLLSAGASLQAKMGIAIVTSILGTLVFLQILQRIQFRDPIVVALVGLMYGGVISAVTVFIAYRRDLLQLIEIWTTGSFSSILRGQYEPLYLVLLGGVVTWVFADRFTVIGMGREFAVNLGLSYQWVLHVGLVVVSVTSAIVVVAVGVIPFLGLVVPNIVRLAMGDDVRRALPVTALVGAGFILACDVVGRTIRFPYEIPVSAVAGVVGAGLFTWLVLRTARRTR